MAFWTLTVEYIRSRCCTTFMSSCSRISKRSQKILHWTVVFHSFSILFIGNHDNRDQLFCTLRVAKHYVWCWYVLEYQTTNTFISFLWPWHSSIQNWYGATKKSLDAKWKENSHCCVISSNSSNASKNKMIWDKLGFFAVSDHSKDAPFTSPMEEFPSIVAGSAFIVPSSTLQKVEPPSIDSKGLQSNVSASIGRTAYLRCKVKNLGHKSVRITTAFTIEV